MQSKAQSCNSKNVRKNVFQFTDMSIYMREKDHLVTTVLHRTNAQGHSVHDAPTLSTAKFCQRQIKVVYS